MSDGPYRSLPMRRACKRLAMRAQKSAFDPQEVGEAVGPALTAHWADEVRSDLVAELRKLCSDRQGSFFEDKAAAFDRLRRVNAGAGTLGGAFIDCCEQAFAEGLHGNDALRHAGDAALMDRALRDARTIEEHYFREGSAKQATRVHARILDGIARASIDALAKRLIAHGTASRTPPKRGGLDEGVALP
jgi:hypothetical protein